MMPKNEQSPVVVDPAETTLPAHTEALTSVGTLGEMIGPVAAKAFFRRIQESREALELAAMDRFPGVRSGYARIRK